MLCTHKTASSASLVLEICPQFNNSYLNQFSTISGGNCIVYLDDVAAFCSHFDSHISLLEKILQCMQDNGFSVNPLKCEWAVQETNFLGHWLTPQGIKPYYKKVNAIVQLEKPKNLKQLHSFLSMVTYYRDMWP